MRAVQVWLYGLCLMVFAMVLLGGATRLTDSGLSITEWQPLMGAIPPLDDRDWQQLFAKYKTIPEYQQVNKGMSLGEFKVIFWWEWSHRLLGRLLGVMLVLPWLAFALLGRLSPALHGRIAVMFALGGLQGFLGWYMVSSGLVERVDVSQYRLAVHLMMAALIIGFILWVALSLGARRDFQLVVPLQRRDRLAAGLLLVLVFVQVGFGALVAGLHAGHIYNSWPLMEGALIPQGLWSMQPWLLNLFENHLTVQFNHRMVAYLITLLALVHGFMLIRKSDGVVRMSAVVLLAAVFAQVVLGIVTLLWVVPFFLALAHQGLAFAVFMLTVRHFYLLRAAG